MPRPAGTEADRRTGHVGEHVANVSRSVRNKQLMHFIADRIGQRDQQRQLQARGRDRSAETTGNRAEDDDREAEVFNRV